jgi:hypothetical protein
MIGAVHFFWPFFALGRIAAMQTIENWSLSMSHLSGKQYRPEGTGRNPRLAQIHHADGVASGQADRRLGGRMWPALPHFGKGHCHGQRRQKTEARRGIRQTASH